VVVRFAVLYPGDLPNADEYLQKQTEPLDDLIRLLEQYIDGMVAMFELNIGQSILAGQ
jgi:hypothetical protein